MNSDNPKIQTFLTLGDPGNKRNWPDYLKQYGFTLDDVPTLLMLYADEEINAMDSGRPEVWAPVHAWRTLGQLGSEASIEPIILSFDTLHDDDYAQNELPKVFGMIGPVAILALVEYWQQPGKNEFSYCLAVDSLCEIAKCYPAHRKQVIDIYLNYMKHPYTSARTLNGLLIGQLMDLKAVEAIDGIRSLFALGCVDLSCAGDLEAVEIDLGFRTQRSTPKPTFAEMHGFEMPLEPLNDELTDEEGGFFQLVENCLMRYGSDDSILDVSELDGFFAALACAPITIMPSTWMHAIWGGEDLAPEWETEKEFTEFSRSIMLHYNGVMSDFQGQEYEPLFLGGDVPNSELLIVDEWCEGFLKGLMLWGEMKPQDMKQLEICLYPIRHFCTDDGFKALVTMSDSEINQLQSSIEPKVKALHKHFYKPVKTANTTNTTNTTFIHATPKVGRNDPCSCGSGKKYKKCCGLN
ncbi:MAG: yecA family protein [Gammaproteobacteria bacterium]|jgi:yecA family protein